MPKMNVNCVVIDDFRAEVSWGDGHVQLATVNLDSVFKVPGHDYDSPEPFQGWHVTLDREHINRLIRALRKARDQAFGADA